MALSAGLGVRQWLIYRWWNERLTENPLISIVDDDDLFRTAIEKLVKSLGLEVRSFSSAESYLQSSWVKTTRCLIADIQMSNMSGLELQEHLSHLGFDIPIIFVTAYPDDAVRTKAMNAGAVCFLQKPIDLQGRRLADCLQDALSRTKRPSAGT
ncbi:response regulator transcription factor [Bradyrhizobium iriomotense]|uniref:Response regulator n=1 Tax=Bradyrhizobium iriomotense TaxID=441950 RepID=A0ABQ6BAN9_9BRAD|nr:response regulator [Bradyrhizobium iriomotense]GLR90843.1 response regulator [Bradyrhizobium iriomotense]